MVRLLPYLHSQAFDDISRGPHDWLVVIAGGLLFLEHIVVDFDDPVLEIFVIITRHDEVANTVPALFAEVGAFGGPRVYVGGAEAFDEILFDTASCCHNVGDVLVLDEIADGRA